MNAQKDEYVAQTSVPIAVAKVDRLIVKLVGLSASCYIIHPQHAPDSSMCRVQFFSYLRNRGYE